jgi:hypothetical protein
MKLKRYTSHLTISSDDNNIEKQKAKNNLSHIEKYIKKLILISIKTKKILEKNDYFYEEEKRKKFNLKNIKIKPTPFQKYQKFKNNKFPILTQNNFNNNNNKNKRILTSYPINNQQRVIKINSNLITISNFNIKHLRKNKTHSNNQYQFYRTHNNFFFKPKRILTNLNLKTEPNNNNFTIKSKTNYRTIKINKSNKIIQTAEPKKRKREKIFSALNKFPILNIFNYHSKINNKLFESDKYEKEERKNKIHLDNFAKIKFSDLLLD